MMTSVVSSSTRVLGLRYSAVVAAILVAGGVARSARAQNPYAGTYVGTFSIEYSGAISRPEASVGPAYVTVAAEGTVDAGQGLSGVATDTGTITWDGPNAFYLSSGTITDGELYSEGSNTSDGLTITYRLRAGNAAGGFGGSVAAELEPVSPTPNLDEVLDVLHDGTQFVALTTDRTVLASQDALTWQYHSIPATSGLNAIAYGNGIYVAAGNQGNLFRSNDLIVWTPVSTADPFTNYNGVAFGNGTFVLVTLHGDILTSADGRGWTERGSVGQVGAAVSFAGGTFVVGGRSSVSSPHQLLASADGVTWSEPFATTQYADSHDLAFGNTVYVLALGTRVLVSSNALDWTEYDPGQTLEAVTFDGSQFVGVGRDLIATSPDGVTWTSVASADTGHGIAFDGSIYVSVGATVARGTAADSWDVISQDIFARFERDVDYINLGASGNGLVLLRGGDSSGGDDGSILRSADGVSWELVDAPESPQFFLFGNGVFAGIRSFLDSQTGRTRWELRTSADGADWTVPSLLPDGVTQLFFANRHFITFATGYGTSYTLTSIDAVHWNVRGQSYNSTIHTFSHLVGLDGAYVALASNGRAYRSTNLLDWTEEAYVAVDVTGIAVGNGRIVAVGSNSKTSGGARILMSPDGGRTWSNTTPDIENKVISAVGFAGGRFVATSAPSGSGVQTLLSSSDGENWTEAPLAVDRSLTGIVGYARGFLLGDEGAGKIVLRSSFPESLAPRITVQPAGGTFAQGDYVTLRASASGDEALRYRWLHNGVPVVDSAGWRGADTDTLTILGLTDGQDGEYRLSVQDGGGSALSLSAHVGLEAGPGFTAQPESVFAEAGIAAELTVETTVPGATVTWLRGNDEVGAGLTLAFPSLTNNDIGAYRAVLTPPDDPPVTSAPAMVSVIGGGGGPQIVVQPQDVVAPAGSLARIEGAVKVNSSYVVRWYKDGDQLAAGPDNNNTAEGSPVLELPNVGPDDVGRYKFYAYQNGTFAWSDEVSLTLGSGPSEATGGLLDAQETESGPELVNGTAGIELDAGQRWEWNGGTDFVRYTAEGTVDGSYDPGVAFAAVHDVAADAAGHIYVAGRGTDAAGGAADRWSLVRLDRNGVRDPSFNTGEGFGNGSADVYAVEVLPNGNVAAGGRFAEFDGVAVNNLAILAPDGSIAANFAGSGVAGGGSADVFDLQLASNGTLLVAGNFGMWPGSLNNALVNLDYNGAVVESFNFPFGSESRFLNSSGTAVVRRVEERQGVVIAAGLFDSFGGQPAGNIVAIRLADGQPDGRYRFGVGFDGEVTHLDADFTGNLVVHGNFSQYRGADVPDTVAIQGLPIDLLITTQPVGGDVDLGSTFQLSVDIYTESDAGFQWSRNGVPIAGGTNRVLQLANVDEDHTGTYRVTVQNATQREMSVPVDVRVVSAPVVDVQPIGATVSVGESVTLSPVVVGAGQVTYAWYREGSDDVLGTGLSLTLPSVGPADAGTYILIAANAYGAVATRPAAIDLLPVGFGVADEHFDPGTGAASGEVRAFLPLPDGSLLVGGAFSSFNGTAAQSLVRLDASGAVDPSFGLDSGFAAGSVVHALALQADGRVVVAGKFTSYAGAARTNVLRIAADGALDPDYDPGASFSFDAPVHDVLLVDGEVVAAGTFSGGVARFSADGSPVVGFAAGGGANGAVNTLHRMADGRIAVGGAFSTYAGSSAKGLAIIDSGSGDFLATESTGTYNLQVHDIESLPDGSIAAMLSFGSVARFLAEDLSIDLQYAGLNISASWGTELVVTPSGHLLVGGEFIGGLYAYTADGLQVHDFPRPGESVYALELDPQGRLLVGGDFVDDSAPQDRTGVSRLFVGGPALRITSLTETVSGAPGGNARLRVGAAGTSPIRYQWYRGASGDTGIPMPKGGDATFDAPVGSQATAYWVRVTDPSGSIDSPAVTVSPLAVPTINGVPANQRVPVGEELTLTVQVAGTDAAQVTWWRDGIAIPGIVGATLSIPVFSADDAGVYTVRAANEVGATTSDPFTLTATYLVEAWTDGPGILTPGTDVYDAGAEVVLTAAADSTDHEFVRWDGDVPDGKKYDPTLNFVADAHRTVIAVFGPAVHQEWLDANSVINPDTDQDGDGFTAREEYSFGTDPNDDGTNRREVTIDLAGGWNLVSLGVQPDPGTRVSDLVGSSVVGPAFWWSAQLGTYRHGGQAVGKRGYWVWAEVVGRESIPVQGQQIDDPTLRLFPGWNLVGPVSNGVLEGDAQLWAWDVENGVYFQPDDGMVEAGAAYWIFTETTTSLQIR